MDRPEVLRAGTDGALIVPGKEWAEFKLGTTGIVTQVLIIIIYHTAIKNKKGWGVQSNNVICPF